MSKRNRSTMVKSTDGTPAPRDESEDIEVEIEEPEAPRAVAYRLIRRGPGLVIEAYDVTGQEPAHRTEPEIAVLQRAKVAKLLRRGVIEDTEQLFRAITGGEVA